MLEPLQELKAGIWKQEECGFTGFLALAWSATFVKPFRPTCLGMISPVVAWTLVHQLANKKMHDRCGHGPI